MKRFVVLVFGKSAFWAVRINVRLGDDEGIEFASDGHVEIVVVGVSAVAIKRAKSE